MSHASALALILDALEAEAPAAVARGRTALARALAWTSRTQWSEVAWSFSDLAGGAPLELVWRPGHPGLFWTAEPAAPEWPNMRRLQRALALARTLGARFSATQTDELRDAVSGSSNPWPIWLSGRHGVHGDTAKLYVRTDRGNAALGVLDRPVMLGVSADAAREEYWRRPRRQEGDLWRLKREPDLYDFAGQLEAALRKWTGRGLDAEAAGSLGLSLKYGPSGKPEALAAFLRVHQAGGADRVREELLADGGAANPALANLWAAGRLQPMLLTLAASGQGVSAAIGLRVIFNP